MVRQYMFRITTFWWISVLFNTLNKLTIFKTHHTLQKLLLTPDSITLEKRHIKIRRHIRATVFRCTQNYSPTTYIRTALVPNVPNKTNNLSAAFHRPPIQHIPYFHSSSERKMNNGIKNTTYHRLYYFLRNKRA